MPKVQCERAARRPSQFHLFRVRGPDSGKNTRARESTQRADLHLPNSELEIEA